MNETKTKYAIYLYPSQMEEIKSLMEQANAKSQSEFVSDAIRFYIGYLQQGKNVNYLAPIIAQCIREEISSTEKGICQICSNWQWRQPWLPNWKRRSFAFQRTK